MKYTSIFLFAVVCLIAGCKPDPHNCPSLPGPGPFGYVDRVDSPYLGKPYFNPNNSKEFLFVEYSTISKLYTYNLDTRQKNKIYEGNILFPPKWSKKNWILLCLSGGNIWKIKNDGDSLTQLTFTGANYYGEWNYDGSRFMFKKVMGATNETLIADERGTVTDTLRDWVVSLNASWQNPEYLTIVSYTAGIIILDSAFLTTKVISGTTEPEVDGVFLCNNCNDLIWTSHGNIYSTELNQLKTTTLHSSCLAIYSCPSTNADKILLQKIEHKYLGDNILETSSKLVLINMDGTNEQILQIE